MPSTIDGYLDHLDGMTPQARAQTLVEAHRMLERLTREIQRVEFADRHDLLDEPEITATMVMKAAVAMQPAILVDRAPRSPRMVALHGLNLGCTALAGVLSGHLNSSWQWACFLACMAGSVASGTYIYRRRWQ